MPNKEMSDYLVCWTEPAQIKAGPLEGQVQIIWNDEDIDRELDPLITLWREQLERTGPLITGIRRMNERLGTRFTNSQVATWQAKRDRPSSGPLKFILGEVLPGVIVKHDVSSDIAERLTKEIIELLPGDKLIQK